MLPDDRATASPLLSVHDLRVTIPTPAGDVHAVRGVSLDVEARRTHCIVGESGSGKSVTAYALLDLLPAGARLTAEAFRVGDRTIAPGSRAHRDLRGRQIAMIFQEPMSALNPTFRIGTQLEDVCRRHHPGSRAETRGTVEALLTRVGLTPPAVRMRQYPHQLSGGQRQRVLIAMALLCTPHILVADEPTTALDVTVQLDVLDLLLSLQAEYGLGLLFITHDIGLVSRIADRVTVMYAGEVVETGPMREVFGNPAHPYTQALLASVPGHGADRRERLPHIHGTVPSLLGGITGCAFRSRCPLAVDACTQLQPLRLQGVGHAVRCARGIVA